MTNTVLAFDGFSRFLHVPAALAPQIVGLDADGDVLIPFFDGFAPLTPCCFASGKGSESPTGVVCRVCFRTVSPKFGCSVSRVAFPRRDALV